MKSIICFICLAQLFSRVKLHSPRTKTLLPDKEFTKYHSFGQISAVDVDDVGDIYVFHRGSTSWSSKSFNLKNEYMQASLGNITEATIVVFSPNGTVITETGRNLFLMPHGLTVDDERNIWITDVALHLVVKFGPIDKSQKEGNLGSPLLKLGENLIPGQDNKHFCKPTSVAIDSHSKDFFVADGYCNSRIMKFDQNGKFLVSWGIPTETENLQNLGPFHLNVPHSLAANQRGKQLIVADRENARVMIYNFDGKFISGISVKQRVYAVAYSLVTDNLYGVTGDTYTSPGSGFIFSMKFGNKTTDFGPARNFKNAHDVAVSPDGQHIYAVELDPHIIWKFTVGSDEKTAAPPSPLGVLEEMKSVLPVDEEETVKISAGPSVAANQLAITIVTVFVLLAIFLIGCHMYRRREKTSSIEMKGLILSDEEERNL